MKQLPGESYQNSIQVLTEWQAEEFALHAQSPQIIHRDLWTQLPSVVSLHDKYQPTSAFITSTPRVSLFNVWNHWLLSEFKAEAPIVLGKDKTYLEALCLRKLRSSPAAATAKSLQSCLTLCNPIDGSPPGSPVPGILQARTLTWAAISFSSAWKWKMKVKSLSRVRLLVIPWTAAYQAPSSMGFSRQEYWSGVPLPSPRSSPEVSLKYPDLDLLNLFSDQNCVPYGLFPALSQAESRVRRACCGHTLGSAPPTTTMSPLSPSPTTSGHFVHCSLQQHSPSLTFCQKVWLWGSPRLDVQKGGPSLLHTRLSSNFIYPAKLHCESSTCYSLVTFMKWII